MPSLRRPQGADEAVDLAGLEVARAPWSASASMVGDVLDVLGGDRCPRRAPRAAAPSSRRSRRRASGSGLKMPPGDLPVTIAHVANVTRSAASRGGTSAPSASVTASWVSTCAAAGPAARRCSARGPSGRPGRSAAAGSAASDGRRRRLRLAARPAGPAPARLEPVAGVAPPISCGLLGGDLLGGLRLLVLVQLLDLVAVLDRVLDQLLDGVQVGVAHRGQLDRRQVEVVLDAVLDPHRHQRVQAELDQRHLPRQVLGLVAHRAADDRCQPVARRSHPNPATTSQSPHRGSRPGSGCRDRISAAVVLGDVGLGAVFDAVPWAATVAAPAPTAVGNAAA